MAVKAILILNEKYYIAGKLTIIYAYISKAILFRFKLHTDLNIVII